MQLARSASKDQCWSLAQHVSILGRREMNKRPLAGVRKERPAWEQRLIFDAASTVAKLLANVQMEAMGAKSTRVIVMCLLTNLEASAVHS
jgi:hypothetical protein